MLTSGPSEPERTVKNPKHISVKHQPSSCACRHQSHVCSLVVNSMETKNWQIRRDIFLFGIDTLSSLRVFYSYQFSICSCVLCLTSFYLQTQLTGERGRGQELKLQESTLFHYLEKEQTTFLLLYLTVFSFSSCSLPQLLFELVFKRVNVKNTPSRTLYTSQFILFCFVLARSMFQCCVFISLCTENCNSRVQVVFQSQQKKERKRDELELNLIK